MRNGSLFILFAVMLLMGSMTTTTYAVAEPVKYVQISGDDTDNGTSTWQKFWSNLYTWLILIPLGFFMALPWVLWAVNKIRAEHEEDPQASYKAKKWFTTAIEIDIVLALIGSGVLFYWFQTLANP